MHPLLSDIAIGCMCISLFCLGNASLSAHIHNSCIYQLIYILRSSQKSIFEVDPLPSTCAIMVPAVVVWLVCTRRHYKCSSWHQCEGSISGFEWPWCAYILTQACSSVLTPPPRNGVTVLHSSGGTAIHQVPPPPLAMAWSTQGLHLSRCT